MPWQHSCCVMCKYCIETALFDSGYEQNKIYIKFEQWRLNCQSNVAQTATGSILFPVTGHQRIDITTHINLQGEKKSSASTVMSLHWDSIPKPISLPYTMTQVLDTCCHFHGLVQDCSNSSVLAMELLQSCTKPSICSSSSSLESWVCLAKYVTSTIENPIIHKSKH